MARTISVEIIGDADQLKRAFGQAETAGQRFGRGIDKAGKAAAIGLAAIGFGAAKAVNSASDLNETVSKTQVVFGGSAAAMLKWSDTTATALGTSKKNALDGASAFGLLFTQIGVGTGKAADMSKKLVTLAADIGSFNNASQPEVQEAMLSAFRGEYDALQRFVPSINAARVQTEAMRISGKKNAKQLTDSEKAQAVYNLTFAQTAKAQGDFKRTSTEAANQQKIMAARTEDLSAKLGGALLPAWKRIQEVLISVTDIASRHTGVVKILAGVAVGLGATLLVAAGAWKVYSAAQAIALVFTNATNAALIAQRVLIATSIVGALILLGVALVVAYKKCETFRNIVNAAFNAVKVVVSTVTNFIRDHWLLVLAVMTGGIGPAVVKIIQNWDKIKDAVSRVATAVVRTWNWLKSTTISIFNGVVNSVIDAVNRAADIINTLSPGNPVGHVGHVGGGGGTAQPGGHNAAGTDFWKGGPTWVGERGKELLNLPRGSQVLSHRKSMALVEGGTRQPIQVNLLLDRRTLASVLVEMNRDHMRVNGGRGLFG
jgi:hypothetical protein